MTDDALWPRYTGPGDLAAVEGVADTVLLLSPTGAPTTEPVPTIHGASVGYLATMASGYDGTVFDGPPPAADDVAGTFHTGGTTGTPKLAAHTHANEVTDAARRVVADALAGHPGVTVAADVDDGSPVVAVTVPDAADRDDVDRVLSRYALAYHVTVTG